MIEIHNVTIKLKNRTILSDINLTFKKGCCYGITGRNGSGKTLLFKAIVGFLPIHSGEILIDGQKQGPFKGNTSLGILIESPEFLRNETAFNNLNYLAKIQNKITQDDIYSILKTVGLGDAIHKKYKNFSLGMKQRLRIAQAIMEDAEYLILDEPFNGLDEQGVYDIRQVLLNLKSQGKTLLLTSHNAEDIDILSDKTYQVSGGQIHEI